MLQELDQPSLTEPVEETADIKIEHPVHISGRQGYRPRVQRPVLRTPRTEPGGEAKEVFLIDGIQYLDHRTLDDFVLQGRDAQRPLPTIRFGYVHPSRGLSSVRPGLQPLIQAFDPHFLVFMEVLPDFAVHSRSR
jgi:hypothetical protein